jgi:hypothetical protein
MAAAPELPPARGERGTDRRAQVRIGQLTDVAEHEHSPIVIGSQLQQPQFGGGGGGAGHKLAHMLE